MVVGELAGLGVDPWGAARRGFEVEPNEDVNVNLLVAERILAVESDVELLEWNCSSSVNLSFGGGSFLGF